MKERELKEEMSCCHKHTASTSTDVSPQRQLLPDDDDDPGADASRVIVVDNNFGKMTDSNLIDTRQ